MAQAPGRSGFTLIELMIALVIVAITTSYALASYRRHLLRSHRFEAVQGLLTAAAEQEKFHLIRGHYSDRLDGAVGDDPPGLPVASITRQQRYRMNVEFADAAAFRIVATPLANEGQTDDLECRQLSIDQSGGRQAHDASGKDSTNRCW